MLWTIVLFRYLSYLNCVFWLIHLYPIIEFFILLLDVDFQSFSLLRLSSLSAFLHQPFTTALFVVVLFHVTLFLIALLAALLFVSEAFLLLLLRWHLPPICVTSPISLASLFQQLIRLQLQLLRHQTFT